MKLDGIRVLDLTQFLPGPFLTQMMADHGAEVVKVEHPHRPEPTRTIGSERGGVSVYFAATQRGKRSLTLDLKTAHGREVFMKLAERCDVVVESFRPGVVRRLGVDYESLREVKEAIGNAKSEKQKEQRCDESDYAESHRGYLPNKGWFIYRPKK